MLDVGRLPLPRMSIPLSYFRLISAASALVVASSGLGSPRQSSRAMSDCVQPAAGFRLDRSLQKRLDMFVAAQRDSDWEAVARLVTHVLERSDGGHVRVGSEVTSRILSELKERPLVGFVPTSRSQSTSELTFPASQRLWQIHGCARYREAGRLRESKGIIWAYSNKGRWLFGFVLIAPEGEGRTIDESGTKSNSAERRPTSACSGARAARVRL